MKWGRFTQRISVINFMGPKLIISEGDKKINRKTKIYQRRYGDKEIIFKNQIFDSSNRSRAIISAFKEIFIGKIACALEFGPICCHETNFDLILY